jgi:hypothetical protein
MFVLFCEEFDVMITCVVGVIVEVEYVEIIEQATNLEQIQEFQL